jgi:aarF domain-containing kinase
VLLDHGLYSELDKDFIYNYSLLWRGIITQNSELIKNGCLGLGVEKHELFVAVVSNKKYQDIMRKELKYETKKRLNPRSKKIFFTKKILLIKIKNRLFFNSTRRN